MKNLWKVFLACFLFFFSLSAMGQEKNISGKVLDDFNESVPGVNVQIKGTMSGTVTDADGNFNITVPNAKSILIFLLSVMQHRKSLWAIRLNLL